MMNKRLLNNLFYGALLFSVSTGVVSCKDYDDDIKNLDNRITTVESDMERFKEKIQAALEANKTVADWYLSEDQTSYTIVLNDGSELKLQASGKSTPFYQFKIEDNIWKYTDNKGAGWYNVKDEADKDIAGTDKDVFYYDTESGFIYINKSGAETGVKTNIQIAKDAPIMALNTENKTLSFYLYGENYILPVQGGGFSGISSILFRKQFVFEEDNFLEAASFAGKNGDILAASKATATFRVLPKDINLEEATFACADIHELTLTRAEAAPQLLVTPVNGGQLDENGILTVELTPQDMNAEYYGAVLEITLDKTTTSSDYFVVKPTSYSANDGVWAYRDTRKYYTDSEAMQFISTEKVKLSERIAWGFGETGEVKFVDELGFSDLEIETDYEVSDNGGGVFSVDEKGILSANAANKSGEVTITYTIGAKGVDKADREIITKNIKIYSVDEALAKGGIALSATTGMLSTIESLYKTTQTIEVSNSQTSLETLGINASKAWKIGTENNEVWTVVPLSAALSSITKETQLSNGEMCLYYDATDKKCYMLVGPQCDNISGNFFAMDDEGTDKALFTKGENQVGIYLSNVNAKYVVQAPVKKAELYKTIFCRGNIDQKISGNNNVRFLGQQYVIPGAYDDVLGYHFTDVALSSLYTFKPTDADFTFILEKEQQNDKTKEQWGGNFVWNTATASITLKHGYELSNYNLLNKKVSASEVPQCGIHFSWTFKAGENVTQQSASEGNEQWFFKDPVRNPGEYLLYFCNEKQACADGRILGTDGAVEHEHVDYSLGVSAMTGDASINKFSQLEAGQTYNLGLAFNHSFWRTGFPYDVYGGPNSSSKLPVLMKYDDSAKGLVLTDYCKKNFCKEKQGKIQLEFGNSETKEYLEIVDDQAFTIKVKKAIPETVGNFQLKINIETDYAKQSLMLLLKSNK